MLRDGIVVPATTAIPSGIVIEFYCLGDFQAINALKPAIVLMAACSGMVVAKTAYYTLRATMPAGVTLCCAAVIVGGWDIFFGIIEWMVSEFF